MAARSTGLFPREGFNLDDALKATGASTTLTGTNLHHAKTVRAICLDAAADTTLTVGGLAVGAAGMNADADLNGALIVHFRGALCADQKDGTVVANAGGGTWYFELVDGPRR